MRAALDTLTRASSARTASRIERIGGRLHASLAYAQIADIMTRDFHLFLREIVEQCHNLHHAMHQTYIEYPIETAFEA
jgi:uncharacterized alpha-E superfamily protein